ncbi:MAG: N5-carboxyaminoimidazole ribonucleotide mutase [Candidatus Bathyarchaeota archaeon B23]|nr:MAG: N5-carboxyaminoimidazole ribonucleotide mutase [Candidatus Bathyarchaeota archaeon B23]
MPRVSIIIGSGSDRELAEKASSILDELGVEHEVVVYSAHRDPEGLRRYLLEAEAEVFIAVAGLSAALPGFIAAHTLKPVIGVPRSVKLLGLDALLSMVQMPTGVPVAVVGVDAAKNAALLAAEILALGDEEVRGRLRAYREGLRTSSRRI